MTMSARDFDRGFTVYEPLRYYDRINDEIRRPMKSYVNCRPRRMKFHISHALPRLTKFSK